MEQRRLLSDGHHPKIGGTLNERLQRCVDRSDHTQRISHVLLKTNDRATPEKNQTSDVGHRSVGIESMNDIGQ